MLNRLVFQHAALALASSTAGLGPSVLVEFVNKGGLYNFWLLRSSCRTDSRVAIGITAPTGPVGCGLRIAGVGARFGVPIAGVFRLGARRLVRPRRLDRAIPLGCRAVLRLLRRPHG